MENDIDTSQSIYGPLLELLESDFSSWRNLVKVQSVGIFLLLVCWGCKLLLLMVECTPPLRIYTIVVLSDHCNMQCHSCIGVSPFCPSPAPLAANANNNASSRRVVECCQDSLEWLSHYRRVRNRLGYLTSRKVKHGLLVNVRTITSIASRR